MLEKAVVLFPEKPDFQEELLNCSFDLGATFEDRGSFRESVQPFETSLAHLERLFEENPDRADLRKALSLRLAVLADHYTIRLDPEDRNPRRALELAQQAVELSPGDDGTTRQSLGWALFRAGDWKGCIETLSEKDFMHCAFLAMAHWKLGDKARARELFDRADKGLADYETRWNPGTYPYPSMLRQVRDEAAALLGVETPSGEAAPEHDHDLKGP